MRKQFISLFVALLVNLPLWGQGIGGNAGIGGKAGVGGGASAGVTPITLDASCTGTGSNYTVPCSSAMTVTAGDTIACGGSGNNYDPVGMFFSDPTNGTYDTVEQIVHPGSGDAEVITAVFQNSAGGSITPQLTNWESITLNFRCYAYKNTRTTLAVDGGGVNLTLSATASNPTAGTAAAPTNANEVVVGTTVLVSTKTVTGNGSWTPGGTLAASGSSYPVYNQYQIQTTATAANNPMTATSGAFIDTQFALLNTGNPAGYRAFTGVYGVPAIAKGNGASATVADLNGATTTLLTTPNDGTGWALNQGSAQTYTTAIAPTGTGAILLQGVSHTFGDAGTSISFTGDANLTEYSWTGKAIGMGHPMWVSGFMRVGSSGITTDAPCNTFFMGGGVTDANLTLQTYYDSTNGIYFILEPYESGSSDDFIPSVHLTLDTDYRYMVHLAGTNEQNHQFLVQKNSGSTWSTTDTFNYPVLCSITGAAHCDNTYLQTNATAHGTGSASSGSTSLTITSGTGTVTAGLVVEPMTGIPYITIVESVTNSGNCSTSCVVTLSQYTTGSVSGTVYFITKPANLLTATQGTVTAGSTAMTIVSPSYNSAGIVVGLPMGGSGLAQGTIVSSVISSTSITLSLPAVSTMNTGAGVSFWTAASPIGFGFGRWSICLDTAVHTYSGFVYDPFNDWGAFAPN